MKKLSDIQLPLGGMPTANLLTAGQPTPEDFKALAAAGLKHVVSLRPASEDAGFDEAALAAQLGLSHTVIPVAGPDDLTLARAKDLDAALSAAQGEPVLVHCASSNRVGALLALRAGWLKNRGVEESLAIGRSGGLTKMEPIVEKLLVGKQG
jgi:uncharacterized protein (TIGR01244 family)